MRALPVNLVQRLARPRIPATQSSTSRSGRFTYIDALRGLAACYVLVYHFAGVLTHDFAPGSLPQPLYFILSHGWLGVEVFFVLSGFVISYSLRDAEVTPLYLGKFALRRSLRLDPPYWLTILVTYFVMLWLSGPLGTGESLSETGLLVANLLYANRILGCPAVVAVGWTLCLEIQLYLTYILLLGLMQWLAARRCADSLARALVFIPVVVLSLLIAYGVLPAPWRGLCCEYWYMFFLGVLASWVTLRQISGWWFFLALLTLGIAVCLRWDVRAVAASVTALSIVLVGKMGRLSSFLDWPVLQHLGRISYSLYLVHTVVGWPLIAFCLRQLGGEPTLAQSIMLFLAATATSLIVAELLYYLVERPTLAMSKRVPM